MTQFDYVALTVLGLSMLLSVMRGLTQEILALLAWVLSFWAATQFAETAAVWMPQSIPLDSIRYIAGFVVVFFVAWLLSAIVRITINQFLSATGLKPVDRFLGAAFGIVRGFLLMLTLVVLAGLTSFPKSTVWRNAMFSPLFEQSAEFVKPWLPVVLASRVKFE
ncbi:CvpA family protein [Chitinibacter fontanus]|uniref:CvpA family protein n=1 Tax=Chitinibacter fontanus TaxID=1737446 RepID=A0A7D5VBT6_9NEIS|nr:CvpA family protein [Chitinibacter fontanus]QLI82914.1 CvpA family protein [Chitinibacter fontanus]